MNHHSSRAGDGASSESGQEAESTQQQRLVKCFNILAKNVPITDQLMEQLTEAELIPQLQNGLDTREGQGTVKSAGRGSRSAAQLTRRQSEQHLFVSMATLEPDRLRQLANCLRFAGHPLMAELLLQTVSSCDRKDSSTVEHTKALLFGTSVTLPQSVADCLADSPEAQTDLGGLLSDRRLLAWCKESLFDPAGADVMSLRRQHAEESWRAAKEVRDKNAAMAELQTKLVAAQSALSERDETIAQLESRLSALAAAAGDADTVDELRNQMEVSRRHQAASESQAQRASARLEAYCAAFDFVLAETRQFESEAAELLPSNSTATDATNGSFVESLRQELDDAHRLASFQADFSDRFLTTCRVMLEERRQLVQLAESLAASNSGSPGGEVAFDPQQPLADELAKLIARQAEENSLLTARHHLLLKVLEDTSMQSSPDSTDANDELVAAVGSLRRQLDERDRRIASLTKGLPSAAAAAESPAPSPPPQPPRRSAAVARAWDEVTPEAGVNSDSGEIKRYSVLPEIQSASSSSQNQTKRRQSNTASAGAAAAGSIPHSHRKATKRESNAKKREPLGKPLPANVVSLT